MRSSSPSVLHSMVPSDELYSHGAFTHRGPRGSGEMGRFSRRTFLRGLFSGAILALVRPIDGVNFIHHGCLGLIEAKARGVKDLAPDFRGEELRYQIRFLWFNPAAMGRVLFEKAEENHVYRAVLEGETSGLIGWLTRYRRDTYISSMELIDGGKRLRPLRFEEDVVIGHKIRKKITFFDYGARKLIKRRMNRRGVFIHTEESIPPGGECEDFLTAFYNFRRGVYGKIQRGKRYRIRTIPKGGISTIDVEVATREEETRRRQGEGNSRDREYYITLFLDKEITRSRTGKIEGWVSKDLVPIEGTIDDVVLVGDVHGFLIGEKRPS